MHRNTDGNKRTVGLHNEPEMTDLLADTSSTAGEEDIEPQESRHNLNRIGSKT